MPELPEVETVRRTVAAATAGKRVVGGTLMRADVWNGDCSWETVASTWVGKRLAKPERTGKQLALWCEPATVSPDCRGHSPWLTEGAVCVHLGMSGRLCVYRHGDALPKHTHWRLDFEDGHTLAFTDPRRFGGLWGYASLAELQRQRWGPLGPDATTIGPAALHRGLRNTRRALKAALLDQSVVAGLGNIYVDELLFATRLSPWTLGNRITRKDCERLVRAMRTLLGRAIATGGTTLRDYVDADGQTGSFALKHRVYGRGGRKCTRCRAVLSTGLLAQRTTVWCERCQGNRDVEGLPEKKEVS